MNYKECTYRTTWDLLDSFGNYFSENLHYGICNTQYLERNSIYFYLQYFLLLCVLQQKLSHAPCHSYCTEINSVSEEVTLSSFQSSNKLEMLLEN